MCAIRPPARPWRCATCSRCSPNSNGGGFAIAHNGNLTNGLTLRRQLIRDRRDLPVDLGHRGDAASRRPLASPKLHDERFIDALRQMEGAYAFVGDHQQEAGRRARPARHPPAGARRARRPPDPDLGDLRPRHNRCQVIVRDIENGEVIVFSSEQMVDLDRCAASPFPHGAGTPLHLRVHLFRPPGFAWWAGIPSMRPQGAWACNLPPKPRLMPTWWCRCPIPACRRPSAMPRRAACPFELGIIRNHYVGRTFIEPTQSRCASFGVRLKHSANRAVVEGKRDRADRRLDRARHDLAEDRQDDARGRRPRGAFPHLLAADHPSRLLRHRHAGPATSCWPRPIRSRRRCASYRRRRFSLAFLSVDGLYKAMGL
jgi:amidophosphoribosyltransferase